LGHPRSARRREGCAGRESGRYSTDGSGDSTWNDAGTVGNNYVLTQTETQYDSNSNPIFMITRDRFHSETNTGPLGNTSTGPLARVSYVGRFYDAANRMTNEVNYGTNGGSVLTARPANLPQPTDPALVTSDAYAADIVQTVAIMGTPTTGSFQLNFNGQTTTAINYNAPLLTVQTALQGLLGAGNVQVIGRKQIGTAPAGPWEVRFTGIYAGKSVPLMTVTNTSLTVIVTASVSADTFQSVTLTGSPSGTFTLTFSTQTSTQTTAPIAYNAPASGPNSVEAALAALSNIGMGNVKVTGANGGPYLVRFTGTLAGTDQLQMTGTGTGFGVAVATVYQNADAGRLQTVTDPRGLVSKTDYDPKNGADAGVSDNSTASPTVGPDGEVYFGVLAARGVVTHSRGWLLQFDAYLNESQPPGAFGWDDTVSIVPSSMVPSYQGPSDYLLMTKYNNYAGNSGGDGVNKIAILDPNVSMFDDIDQTDVMNEVLTAAGVTPDPNFPDDPGAVREWCINNAAVDPFTNSILANSEDGSLYRWDLTTNTFTESMALTDATGEAYTPTIIGVDGTVYAINNATLFALQAVPTYNGRHGSPLSDANLTTTEIQSIGIDLFRSADIDSFHARELDGDLKNSTAPAALTGVFDNLVQASGSRHKPSSPALLQDASQLTTTGSRLGTTSVLPVPDDPFVDLFGPLSLGDPIHTSSK
jgi:hypothetical protein